MICLDRWPRAAVVPRLLALVLMTSCSIPRDTEHTLDRVRGRELRVGVTDHPPLIEVAGERMSGDAPWTAKAAFTKPWRTDADGTAHVLAARLGENAWLVEIETLLHSRQQAGSPSLGATQ